MAYGDTFRKKILLPICSSLGTLLLILFAIIYYTEHRKLQDEVGRSLSRFTSLYRQQLENETERLDTILEMLGKDEHIALALQNRDRDRLLTLAGPVRADLGLRRHITHFSFYTPDRRTFLCVSQPDKFGDQSERFTLNKAFSTGRPAAGIELDEQRLLLRVVRPLVLQGKIIGFAELGEEIDPLIRKLHEVLEVELYVSVYKKDLEAANSQPDGKNVGLGGDPEDSVILVRTGRVPPDLPAFLRHGHHSYMEMDERLKFRLEGRRYRVGVVPFLDAQDKEIGDISILCDVTGAEAAFRKTLFKAGATIILAGVVLVVFFSRYLGGLEKEISWYESHLEELAEERTKELSEALSEIKTLRGILPICSFCKQIRDDQGYWRQVEEYLHNHTDAKFTHSICPVCARKHYPGLYK